jgi:hypothetical protein
VPLALSVASSKTARTRWPIFTASGGQPTTLPCTLQPGAPSTETMAIT